MRNTKSTTRDRAGTPHPNTYGRAKRSAAPVAVLTALLLAGTTAAHAAAERAPLGTAGSFAVLAGSGITNTGPTTITGDIGTFPTPTISGSNGLVLNGVDHAANAVTQQAKDDLVLAYDNVAAQDPTTAVAVDLGGSLLTPGVYSSGNDLSLTGTVTLDAQGDSDAVFVFKSASTLITATDSKVELINGAQACNVYWQVASSATLGVRTDFAGTVLALTSITMNTEATLEGRVLARNGAVTLDTNTITRPECSTPAPAPTPDPTASPAPTPTSPAPAPTSPAPAPQAPSDAPVNPAAPATGTPTPERADSGTPQVVDVPSGGVATGAGSTAQTTNHAPLLAALAAAGALAAVLTHRVRTARGTSTRK